MEGEGNDTSSLRSAFIKGLPSFSLPPNLNSKLVANKKKNQLNRPRLSNLRSAWLSTQSIEEDVFSEDKLIDITLPPVNKESGVLAEEIQYSMTLATCVCLSTPILASVLSPTLYLHSLLIAAWVSLLAWQNLIRIGRSDPLLQHKQLKVGLLSSLFMLFSLSVHQPSLSLITVNALGTILYLLAFRLLTVQKRVVQQLEGDHVRYQTVIDDALTAYYDRRHMFLTTVSQEIRDASLMVIATLEQFSPTSILSNSHELLSACSIAVPITSITAINTTIKGACHISSHLNLISRMLREANTKTPLTEEEKVRSTVKQDFDVSELIQNVGDALAGMASKLGVHFVIYHTDNGLYYSNVIGDQDAIKHALINLLRNILEGCTPGACIELGLYIAIIPDTPRVRVTFDIIQTASPAIPVGVSGAIIPNANFTAQLLSYIGGVMNLEDLGKNRTRVEVSIELLPGCNIDQRLLLIEKPSQILEKQFSNIRFSNEPTLEDLSGFITQLKGVKMILHAHEKSIFAKHLTSCLTSWNTDISHVPVLGFAEMDDGESSTAGSESSISTVASTDTAIHSILSPNSNRSSSSKVPSPAIEEDHIHSIPPAFILIDDDILTLEKKVREFRDQPMVPPTPATNNPPRRHRRSKSRQGEVIQGTVAIVFFTCLSNYKRVRDIVHWVSTLDLPPTMPRVVVVPKPAGPRRFLTALHTAWNNAIVEPQFIPIATSPLSPFINLHVGSPSIPDTNSAGSITPNGLGPPTASGSMAATAVAGGATGTGTTTVNSLMTPHDPTRFSPGRRNNIRVSSPLGMEVEKGNYFFDPVTPSARTSPATPLQQQQQQPVGTPNEMKRRMRSHSNTFAVPMARRGMLDMSQASPVKPLDGLEPLSDPSQMSPVTNVQAPSPVSLTPATMPMTGTTMDGKGEEKLELKAPVAVKPKQKLAFIISNRKRKEKSKKSDKPSPPITVLIVEDNMINQAILSTWMKKHKIKFSVACDGKEAVEKWKGGGFHLILVSLHFVVVHVRLLTHIFFWWGG
ncbi:uncharacterized protein EV154DRAFT_510633 [Mucor mucedo]|uniref:uncharacterized protein n=1 Tax=Mucor mucedo TaxID=29922 RepID=UPI0022204723|nr:uncharacterized protein EV154DRAFT_510633 [Mucor mucedo]KAI7890680.1 hypothetical protein EV154DRAFT_510633 [Mucor mucedo]